MTDKTTSAKAVGAAKKAVSKNGGEEILTLSTGVRAKLRAVSANLIQEVVAAIKDPPVPMWFNEDKGREEPNPLHPEYQAALADAENERVVASLDAIVIFGLDLVDGVPDDDGWMRNLRLMERRGHIDLSGYVLDDELDREFLYKKYIALGSDDLVTIARKSGLMNEELVEQARSTFRGKPKRRTNRRTPAVESDTDGD